MSTLVIGVGNPLRGDDGAAAQVLALLERAALNGVSLLTALSLLPEMAAEIARHACVVFVDADMRAERVTLQRVTDRERSPLHGFSPSALVAFARTLGFRGDAWVCGLPVSTLDDANVLSLRAQNAAQAAAALLSDALRDTRHSLDSIASPESVLLHASFSAFSPP